MTKVTPRYALLFYPINYSNNVSHHHSATLAIGCDICSGGSFSYMSKQVLPYEYYRPLAPRWFEPDPRLVKAGTSSERSNLLSN